MVLSSDDRTMCVFLTIVFPASSAVSVLIKYLMNKWIYERKLTGNIKKVKTEKYTMNFAIKVFMILVSNSNCDIRKNDNIKSWYNRKVAGIL